MRRLSSLAGRVAHALRSHARRSLARRPSDRSTLAQAARGAHPRPSRHPPSRAADVERPARRRRPRRRRSARPAGSAPRRRVSRDRAARRVRGTRAGPRGHGPAQRDLRAARARGDWPARSSISRTATRRSTTCSRCRRRKRFDLGRYAAGRLEVGALRSPGRRARVLRHPLAHERVRARVQPSVLRSSPTPTADSASSSVPAGTYTVVGWYEGEARTSRAVTVPPGAPSISSWSCRDARALGSLTNRIFLASTLLATVSIGVRGVFRQQPAAQRSRGRAAARPREAASLVDQQRATLFDTFTRTARLDRRSAEVQGGRRDARSRRRSSRSRSTTSSRPAPICCS